MCPEALGLMSPGAVAGVDQNPGRAGREVGMPGPTDWEKREADAIRKEYAALAGATLVEVRPARMCGGEVVAEIEVRTRAGQRVVLQAWRDPEGNGPGHLCVTEA
jgi:hypothetical protein